MKRWEDGGLDKGAIFTFIVKLMELTIFLSFHVSVSLLGFLALVLHAYRMYLPPVVGGNVVSKSGQRKERI